MRKLHRPLCILGTAAVAACAAPASSIDNPEFTPAGVSGNEVRVGAPPPSIIEFPYHTTEAIWKALPAAFAGLKIPAQVMDARGLVYGNARVTVSSVDGSPLSALFRCANAGSGPSGATALRIQFGITAAPRPAGPEKSELVVHTTAFARNVDSSRSGNVNCVSNGQIETRLKQQLLAELAGIR